MDHRSFWIYWLNGTALQLDRSILQEHNVGYAFFLLTQAYVDNDHRPALAETSICTSRHRRQPLEIQPWRWGEQSWALAVILDFDVMWNAIFWWQVLWTYHTVRCFWFWSRFPHNGQVVRTSFGISDFLLCTMSNENPDHAI